MMKRRIACMIAYAAVLLAAAGVHRAAFAWDPFLSLRTYKYVLEDDPPLTEELAVELTRRTMQSTLRRDEELVLRRYSGGEDAPVYMGRNRANENLGTVAWEKRRNGRASYFGVNIEKRGQVFVGRIWQWW